MLLIMLMLNRVVAFNRRETTQIYLRTRGGYRSAVRDFSHLTIHFSLTAVLSERPDRFRFRNFVATLFAGPARVVGPEIAHGLTEMFDNVSAIKVDVFDQRSAFLAIENHMLLFTGRTSPLDHYADRIGRSYRRVRDIGRDKEGFSFPYQMINDPVAFPNPDLNVPFQLIKILFGIDQVKIVTRVRPFDNHDKEITTVIKILITNRWFEFFAILVNPVLQINRRLDS